MSGVSNRPLSGLRVIDCGQFIAGPAAAMMLADFEAAQIDSMIETRVASETWSRHDLPE